MKQLFPKKDISPVWFWLGVAVLTGAKFVLSFFQRTYVWVGGAPIDDELMFRAAEYITAGQWLGPYDWLTLSKHMFFPLWLALLHWLHLPYLGANQLLWAGACLALVQAFAPVLQKRWARLAAFGVMVFLPSAMASFTLRVYRDSIFPALCLLFFAGVAGYALRYHKPVKNSLGWQLLAGLGLAASWLCREDGYWLVPFLGAGTLILVWFILREKELNRKPLRCLTLLIPFGVTAGLLGVFAGINLAYYGVFTISDFSYGSFAQAMGAMNRVEEEEFVPLVSVPYEVRQKIYDTTDAMDCLEYWLEEDPSIRNSYMNPESGDYRAGGFYWAVRLAAQNEGKYESAHTAREYWQQVADEINAACDSGALPSEGGKRSGTAPSVRSEYVLPVIQEAGYSLWFCATFQDCEPYYEELRSIGTAEELAVWGDYLGSPANAAAQEGSDLPYYSPLQKLVYLGLNVVRMIYAVVLPFALVLAVFLQIRKVFRIKESRDWVIWWILTGLLGMALLRVFLIAFMEVAAFQIGTYVMYLATVHPLLALYAFMGIYTGWEVRPWRR